jgi:hypothetical protein
MREQQRRILGQQRRCSLAVKVRKALRQRNRSSVGRGRRRRKLNNARAERQLQN